MKVCRVPGCPALIPATAYRGMCDDCRREYDAARGTREQRGYGRDHQRIRAELAAAITRGETITCWRCHLPITTASDLHLGHDDHDRTITRGPEHGRGCNLSAAGKARHGG